MASQLTFADVQRRRGPRLAVLPDAARVEERLALLARAHGFVAGKIACSLADLERELVREARKAGRCPAPASPQALALALREAAREHSQGPFFHIREQPGDARALGEPQRAVRLAVEAVEQRGPLPALLARAGELQFEGILDWTPLRLRLATALSSRLPVRVRLPWSSDKPELTEALEATLRAFEKLGDGPELALVDPASGPLAPFLQRLFAPSGPPVDGPVELVSCASSAAQAREVARRCAALLAAGAPPGALPVSARALAGGGAGGGVPAAPPPRGPRGGAGATRAARPGEHGAALLTVLSQWGLQRRLRASEPDDSGPALERAVAAALARDQAAVRALEEACVGLARGAAQIGLQEKKFARAEWAQLLSEALEDASLPPGGARGGAVQLVELRELPERSFDHLFVVGLVDGELPARPAADPLLSDEDRRAVNRAAQRPVFRAPAEGAQATAVLPPRQAEEPLLFHLALSSARKSVALLWPRADAQGREGLRSPFVDEGSRALGRSAGDGLPIAWIPQPRDCAGPSDLLARAALDAFAEPAFRVSPPPDAAAARRLRSAG